MPTTGKKAAKKAKPKKKTTRKRKPPSEKKTDAPEVNPQYVTLHNPDGSIYAMRALELCANAVCPHCITQGAKIQVGTRTFHRAHLENVTEEWLDRGIIA